MLISETNKYIFIANPKTGTSTIQKYLWSLDNSLQGNSFTINSKKINAGEHITAFRLKKLMGEEYDKYKKIVYVRNPYAKVVSGYFFYKKGGKDKYDKNRSKRKLVRGLNILLVKYIPFKIWSLIHPYKSNKSYITDANNNIIVDYIGRTEHLEDDLAGILSKIGLEYDTSTFSSTNKSKHSDPMDYYKNPIHKFLFDILRGKDIRFYNSVVSKL